MSADLRVEAVARYLAGLNPEDEWPTNEQLGGGPTGTRDDEYRWAHENEAREILEVADRYADSVIARAS